MNAGANPSLRVDAQDPITASTTPSSERRLSIPTPPSTKLSKTAATTTPKPTKIVLDAAAAKKTAEEALLAKKWRAVSSSSFPSSSDVDLDIRPTKLQTLDQTLTSPASAAPVTPMFAQGNSNSTSSPTSGNNSAAISPSTATVTTTKTVSVPTSIFPGFDIDAILRDPEFEAQLEDDDGTAEICYACLYTLNNSCFLLLCRMGIVILVVGMEEMERRRSRMDQGVRLVGIMRNSRGRQVAEAWKLHLGEDIKAAAWI
ncbi:hypothetical protein TWF225_001168 [Orbilia oligospora]|nr:hypothetical protein TWF225_001168 [Orbilia oligospora]KAF3234921.1 hypothetical protein TWF128_002169 [Orbilia oligospora]KAF3238146.1 hypothetical protein TWF217_001787 [Orbilia oligospora]KAF3276507.1 hypothetical protein TWF132_002162 [Orbilia oligospora]